MKSYLAAAVQMTSLPDLEKNLQQAEELIDLAVRRGAELIGLPENFSYLGDEAEKIANAAQIAEQTEKFLKTMAQRYQVTLLGGGFPMPASEGRVTNTALLISPDGQELTRYDKVHLFDVNLPDGNTYRESSTVVPGTTEPPVYDSAEFGKLGLSICYDVRFPEHYRHMADMGVEVIFVPAAFTAFTGRDHWQVLLQARAIENTAYVIAPAQTGVHYGRRQSHGQAMVIDPWGLVLANAGREPGIAVAAIEPERLLKVRQQMPSLEHRVLTCRP